LSSVFSEKIKKNLTSYNFYYSPARFWCWFCFV